MNYNVVMSKLYGTFFHNLFRNLCKSIIKSEQPKFLEHLATNFWLLKQILNQ